MTRKNSKKLRKVLTLSCCAALLVCLTIAGTVAYLTSTDSVTNTFTVGSNVKITLDEAKVDENGKAITGEGAKRVQENSYKLFPGGTYDKDPTIHVDDECEEAYLRVKVVFEGGAAADKLGLPMLEIFKTIDTKVWTIGEKEVSENDVTYILTYNTKIDKTTPDIILFKTVEIPSTMENADMEKLNNIKMQITAYAVQAQGFDSAEAAFAAASLGV